MKWMIFVLLFACSSKEEPKPERERIVIPTESETRPVSPYTVKPCYCMKIFQPVCAGGQVYGNSCEAECQGHKTWTEGECPGK